MLRKIWYYGRKMYIFIAILLIIGFAAIAYGINNLWRVPDWILEPIMISLFIAVCTLFLLGIWI